MTSLGLRTAAGAARKLVESFGVTDPAEIDVEAWAYHRGVIVKEGPLQGATGRLVRRGNRGVIRVDSSIAREGQKRFTVAHELGHFILHENRISLAACDAEAMLAWYHEQPEEPEANSFAAELLMPHPLFKAHCTDRELTHETIERLAETFRTTMTATALRYVDVGKHVCAIVVSQAGAIRWFRKAEDFRFRIRANRTRVGSITCAADFFQRGETGKLADEVPATEWLEDNFIEPGWMIRELLVPMPSFNTALSILWVVPGSELDAYDEEEED